MTQPNSNTKKSTKLTIKIDQVSETESETESQHTTETDYDKEDQVCCPYYCWMTCFCLTTAGVITGILLAMPATVCSPLNITNEAEATAQPDDPMRCKTDLNPVHGTPCDPAATGETLKLLKYTGNISFINLLNETVGKIELDHCHAQSNCDGWRYVSMGNNSQTFIKLSFSDLCEAKLFEAEPNRFLREATNAFDNTVNIICAMVMLLAVTPFVVSCYVTNTFGAFFNKSPEGTNNKDNNAPQP